MAKTSNKNSEENKNVKTSTGLLVIFIKIIPILIIVFLISAFFIVIDGIGNIFINVEKAIVSKAVSVAGGVVDFIKGIFGFSTVKERFKHLLYR